MKLHTDRGNFQTLKVLVAAELSQIKLDIKEVQSEGKW